ncbi:UPF0711 protein C18orf21 homolog isoform X1 [Callorhinchus milii]|uniref:Uncharacterized protein n=1 Tax=Callorhinchus milii TaxID=7868 RepID=A0A4W3IG52_CALMI|nr:UPF0711 protein C18orf21 homolog isoform X1 [Callorhinchus milii]XP_007900808.1 UPF0711 protein C18orf21 homolog isoform X1 [Callorhinchus milii]|eukprot:gi/632968932/ref/XP_007900807.1/ PREDICTED: UPF0711 protein C18orf21 homolog isoform X1 [Callorhinchus milii]
MNDEKKKQQFLLNSALQLQDTCPAEARYLLWKYYSAADSKVKTEGVCSQCYQYFRPGNHRVRIKAKVKMTQRIKRLLRYEVSNGKLRLKHVRQLKKYRSARSTLLVTCYTCNETSRCYGANRAALIAASGRLARSKLGAKAPEVQRHQQTPGLAMGYSQHLNKPGSKGKNPTTAPRTFTSTPSTSSAPLLKSVKAKKLHCSRLKMLLNCEQKQPSKKGTLKDFLSSV